jgi:hypothetical protein
MTQESSNKIQLSFYKKINIKEKEKETNSNKSNQILYNKRLFLKKYCKCIKKANIHIDRETTPISKTKIDCVDDEKTRKKNSIINNSLNDLLKYYI